MKFEMTNEWKKKSTRFDKIECLIECRFINKRNRRDEVWKWVAFSVLFDGILDGYRFILYIVYELSQADEEQSYRFKIHTFIRLIQSSIEHFIWYFWERKKERKQKWHCHGERILRSKLIFNSHIDLSCIRRAARCIFSSKLLLIKRKNGGQFILIWTLIYDDFGASNNSNNNSGRRRSNNNSFSKN